MEIFVKAYAKKMTALALSVILIAITVMSFAPAVSAATYSGECGDNLTWTLDAETGELTISGTGDMWDNMSVQWYSYRSSIKTVTIGNSVTSIGDLAFSQCSGLTSITIPDGVTSIGNSAFYCCYGLTSVTIPSSVTSIGDFAFDYCSGLMSITIGSGVTSIGDRAFRGCSGLESITVASGNSIYRSENNCIIEKATNTLILGCKNSVIPSSVTRIGDHAFDGRSGLTSVTIPSSVTSIGYGAFDYCSGLTSVTIPSSVTSIGDRAFRGCSGLESITVASGNIVYKSENNCLIEKATNTLILGCKNSVIPSSVTRIGYYAFDGCSGLTSITIPDGVTRIGDFAFYDCSGLTSVTIPDGVTRIGDWAFYGCNGLASVTIGSGVTSIGEGAFYGCIGLTSVTIPDGVTSIGNQAFYGCIGLTSVTIGSGVTSIGYYAFYDCSGLESITVASGNSVYKSENNCLIEKATNTLILGCKNSVIPSSVTRIGNYAFDGCSGLTSVTIPSSVTSIGDFAFRDCRNISKAYYLGTEDSWKKVTIGSDNSYLTNKIIFHTDHTYDNALDTDCNECGYVRTVADASGDYGESCTWEYTAESKTLTLKGNAVEALTGIDAPWKNIADKLSKIVISKDVGAITGDLFAGASSAELFIMGDPEIEDGALSDVKSIHGWTGTHTDTYCRSSGKSFTALEEFDALGYQIGNAQKNMFRVIAQMRYANYYETAGYDITAVGSDGYGHSFDRKMTKDISMVYKSIKASTKSGGSYTAVTADEDCYLSAIGITGLPAMASGARIVFTVTPFVYNIYSGEKISLEPVMLQYTADGISQYVPFHADEGTSGGIVIDWDSF